MTTPLPRLARPCLLAMALSLALPALAQTHAGHHRQHEAQPDDPHAKHRTADDADTATTQSSQMDHAAMDHTAMGHAAAGAQATPSQEAHAVHAMSADLPADALPRTPIPPVTSADRAAAFQPLQAHRMHGKDVHYYAALNRLETWDADEGDAFAWEGSGWVGTDLDRLWLRSEGEHVDGSLESADVEVFYGRAIARWWDAVIGLRHDFGDAPSQTFAAIGVMGMAPYKFEVEATAYVGESGQTGLGLEAEYETLFTNRLVGQWLVEAEAWGQDDPERGIGAGLGTLEAGFRLRYEFDRQFAPYIGVTWERAYGDTADLRRDDGHAVEDTRLVVGLRTWF